MRKMSLKSIIATAMLTTGLTSQAQFCDFGKNVFDNPLVPITPYNDIARDVSVLSGLNTNLSITVGSFQKSAGANNYDGYVMARLSDITSNESIKWYITIEGAGNDEVNAVDTRTVNSTTGHIYITGSYTGSANMILHYGFPIHHFTTTINPAPLVAQSSYTNDATYFVTKLDQNGTHIWTYLAGEPTFYNKETGNDVNVNVVGGQVRVYTTGFYRSTPIFYSAGPAKTVPTASTAWDAIFTAQYTDNGSTATCNWVSTIGEATSAHDHGYGVASDKSTGNVYMTGAVAANVTTTAGPLTVSGTSDVLLCKYNSSGNLLWAQNFGGNGVSGLGTEMDAGRGITYRKEGADNYLYVSGAYAGTGIIFTPPPSNVLAGFFTKIKDTGTGISFSERNNIIGTGTTIAYRNTVSEDGRYWYIVGSKTGSASVRHNNSAIVSTLPPVWQPTVADGFMLSFYADLTTTPTPPSPPFKDAITIGGGEFNDVAAGVTCVSNVATYLCGSYKSTTLGTSDGFGGPMNFDPAGNVNDAYILRYIPLYPKDAVATGLEESNLTDFAAYPNPTSGALTLLKRSDEAASIEIMDMTGHLVQDKLTTSGTSIRLDLSDLSAGLYLIRITEGDKVQNLKVTKQ